MKKEKTELLELQQKTLALAGRLSFISDLSWRLKKAEKNIEPTDISSTLHLLWEYSSVLGQFINYAEYDLDSLRDEFRECTRLLAETIGKEAQDEN